MSVLFVDLIVSCECVVDFTFLVDGIPQTLLGKSGMRSALWEILIVWFLSQATIAGFVWVSLL